MVRSCILFLELAIAFFVENDSAAVLFYLFYERLFVNVNSALVWLVDLLDSHKSEHRAHSLPHSIVAMPHSPHPCFAISSDNID